MFHFFALIRTVAELITFVVLGHRTVLLNVYVIRWGNLGEEFYALFFCVLPVVVCRNEFLSCVPFRQHECRILSRYFSPKFLR